MNVYADSALLEEAFRSLASKEEGEKSRAVTEIKHHLEVAVRELSLERFARFENDLYKVRVQTSCNSINTVAIVP